MGRWEAVRGVVWWRADGWVGRGGWLLEGLAGRSCLRCKCVWWLAARSACISVSHQQAALNTAACCTCRPPCCSIPQADWNGLLACRGSSGASASSSSSSSGGYQAVLINPGWECEGRGDAAVQVGSAPGQGRCWGRRCLVQSCSKSGSEPALLCRQRFTCPEAARHHSTPLLLLQRLAKLPMRRLVPKGFVFVYVQKQHVQALCRQVLSWRRHCCDSACMALRWRCAPGLYGAKLEGAP